LESRKTLAGYWKLNTMDSDDPAKKLEEARQTKADSGGGPGGGGGGGRVGVGFPPYPGGGGTGPNGGGGRRMGGEDNGTSERIQEMVRPDYSQSITLKDPEVDVTDDGGRKLVYYTDGRKIQKSKDDSFNAVLALGRHAADFGRKGSAGQENDPNAGTFRGREAFLRDLEYRKRQVGPGDHSLRL
jgi:hypothetical protein